MHILGSVISLQQSWKWLRKYHRLASANFYALWYAPATSLRIAADRTTGWDSRCWERQNKMNFQVSMFYPPASLPEEEKRRLVDTFVLRCVFGGLILISIIYYGFVICAALIKLVIERARRQSARTSQPNRNTQTPQNNVILREMPSSIHTPPAPTATNPRLPSDLTFMPPDVEEPPPVYMATQR